jgi:hypothetical protein
MLFLPFLAVAALNTGDDLLAACVGDGPNKIACTAMVMGVANGAMLASQDMHQKMLCFLPGLTPPMLTEAVRKYLDAHPEVRSKPAPLLAYRALKEALPCSPS